MSMATAEKRIDKGQIKRIHTIKNILMKAGKISEEDYRVRVQDIHGFSRTSKDMSWIEADLLERQLEAIAMDAGLWMRRPQAPARRPGIPAAGPLKYSDLGDRPGMAVPSQLRLIEATWAGVTRYAAERDRVRSLRSMCWRICKVNDLIFLKREDVNKMIKAIKSMQHKRGY
jgi:hypothetical protein